MKRNIDSLPTWDFSLPGGYRSKSVYISAEQAQDAAESALLNLTREDDKRAPHHSHEPHD